MKDSLLDSFHISPKHGYKVPWNWYNQEVQTTVSSKKMPHYRRNENSGWLPFFQIMYFSYQNTPHESIVRTKIVDETDSDLLWDWTILYCYRVMSGELARSWIDLSLLLLHIWGEKTVVRNQTSRCWTQVPTMRQECCEGAPKLTDRGRRKNFEVWPKTGFEPLWIRDCYRTGWDVEIPSPPHHLKTQGWTRCI